MTEPHLEHSIFGNEPEPEAAPPGGQASRPTGRGVGRPPRGRGPARLVLLIVALAVIAGGGYAGVRALGPLVDKIGGGTAPALDYPGPGGEDVSVTVGDGDTGAVIAATLLEADVIRSTEAFVKAAAVEPAAAGIQPGTYTLQLQMKASAALSILIDPTNRTVPRVTVREGLWASEVYTALSKGTGLPVADYRAAAKKTGQIGLPSAAKGNVEGYLFPATYEFPAKSTAVEQLTMMVAKTVTELENAGVDPADFERTMILASIVEAEANREQDRPKVARVLLNRDEISMKLELDSTVSYGVKHRSITTTDAERADDNPWNTYLYPGLPVGPINNPGAAAIEAAGNPADGPWLFFVAVNPETGETKFATTFAEHQVNVAEFQRWCNDHPGVC